MSSRWLSPLLFAVALAPLGCSEKKAPEPPPPYQTLFQYLSTGESASCGNFSGSLTEGSGQFTSYGCVPSLATPGSEWIVDFTCPTTGEVVVNLANHDQYPIVTILRKDGDIDPNACVSESYYSARFACTQGEQFYVVVDHEGAVDQEMNFDIQFNCAGDTTETECGDNFDNDGDYLYDCSDPDCVGTAACPVCDNVDTLDCNSQLVLGTTGDFGSSDILDSYFAMPGLETTGREKVYVFTPTVSESVVFTTAQANGYPVLAVLHDTGNGCMAGDSIAGDFYSIRFEAVANETYYLVVDGISDTDISFQASLVCGAPTAEAVCDDGIDGDGDYLTDCNDPDCDLNEACLDSEKKCTNKIEITCDTALQSYSTSASQAESSDRLSNYACTSSEQQSFRELVFNFRSTKNQDVLFTLSNETDYAMINIVGAGKKGNRCSPNKCKAGDFYGVEFRTKKNKDYSVIVEGVFSDDVDFDITVLCQNQGLETNEAEATDGCTDGIDNDGDNLIDCDDPECESECTSGGDMCASNTTLSCGQTLPGSIAADDVSAIDSYPCALDIPVDGGEATYRFTATRTEWVNFTLSEMTDYASVHIVEASNACDPYYCIASQYYSTVGEVQAGQDYFVIVDGLSPGVGVDFNITAICAPPFSESGDDCSDGLDNDADFLTDCDDPDCACGT